MTVDILGKVFTLFRINQTLFAEHLEKCHFRHFVIPACLRQAGARAYLTSKQRARDLPLWTHSYHWHRPHSGMKQQTPIGQLNLKQNNLVRLHI